MNQKTGVTSLCQEVRTLISWRSWLLLLVKENKCLKKEEVVRAELVYNHISEKEIDFCSNNILLNGKQI